MKKYIVVWFLLLLLIITPSVSFASWWNPLTWFSSTPSTVNTPTPTKTIKTKTPTKKPTAKTSTNTGCAPGNLFNTTTGKPCTGTTTTTTPTTATTTTTTNNASTNGATNTPTILPPPATGQYSMQDCYNECENYPGAAMRDACKHVGINGTDYSCDFYGKPSSALDNFVNNLKHTFANQQTSSFQYTVQDCYNECENYSGAAMRDACKHVGINGTDYSCDFYGKPSTTLDNFVNNLKSVFTKTQVNTTSTNNQGQNATYDTGQ